MKIIKILLSPFEPDMEEAYNLIFQIFPPYGETFLNLIINPNITNYAENADINPDIKIRQVVVSENTSETIELYMDFGDNNEKTFEMNGKSYTLKLLNIDKENIKGQDFPFFEFSISETTE